MNDITCPQFQNALAEAPVRNPNNYEPIVIFKGGGYDGCIWEWNAVFFDIRLKPLERQPLLSGYSGRDMKKKAQKSLLEACRYAKSEAYGDNDKWLLLASEDSWKLFAKEWNKGFIRSVARVAQHNIPCDRCDRWVDADDIFHTGYQGDGGIGVQYDDNHCAECADELHEEYAAKEIWPDLSVKEKFEAYLEAKSDGFDGKVFSSIRSKTAPFSFRYYDKDGPTLY